MINSLSSTSIEVNKDASHNQCIDHRLSLAEKLVSSESVVKIEKTCVEGDLDVDVEDYSAPTAEQLQLQHPPVANEETPSFCVENKTTGRRKRKRRVKDDSGSWIDERDREGRTIDHEEERRKELETLESVKIKRVNPFQLISCSSFDEFNKAPFSVEMSLSAVLLMDVHAHLSMNEVNGLVGGTYDQLRSVLSIELAVPCICVSTSRECEMDPVSQNEASEALALSGTSVVGWYHSHPIFDPIPSKQDIQTQLKYQEWFSKGKKPFVSLIVNPFRSTEQLTMSKLRCLIVHNEFDEFNKCNVPYNINYSISHGRDTDEIIRSWLPRMFNRDLIHDGKIELLSQFRSSDSMTFLEKLLESVRYHTGKVCDDEDRLVSIVSNIIMENINRAETHPETS